MHAGMSKIYLGYGYIVVQVSECHGHGVKGQHHPTLCLTLALPAYPTPHFNLSCHVYAPTHLTIASPHTHPQQVIRGKQIDTIIHTDIGLVTATQGEYSHSAMTGHAKAAWPDKQRQLAWLAKS